MTSRTIEINDLDTIRAIHEKYYSKEFSINEFRQRYHHAYLVEDSDGIICAGGLRPIAEMVIVTDKGRDPETRKEALFKMLDVSIHYAKDLNYNAIHAFIQDAKWKSRLIKSGFETTAGEALIFKF